MKLSKREQRMLLFLLFFAMWVLTLKYVILPERAKMKTYAIQLDKLQERKAEIEHALSMKDSIRVILNEQLAAAGEGFFYRDLDAVAADQKIQRMAEAAGVQIVSMSLISESVDEQGVTEYIVGGTSERDSETEAEAELPVTIITAVVAVTGTTREIVGLADTIRQTERSVLVSGLDIREQSDSADARGSITVVFYSLDEDIDEAGDVK